MKVSTITSLREVQDRQYDGELEVIVVSDKRERFKGG